MRDYLLDGLTSTADLQCFFRSSEGNIELDQQLFSSQAEQQIVVAWRNRIEWLEQLPTLKWIFNPGAGVQHHMGEHRDLYRRKGIRLVNGHGNAGFTAEHTLALLLNLSRGLFPHHRWMTRGRWRLGDKELKARPLSTLRIGIAGYGHIGKTLARLLAPHQVAELRALSRTKKSQNDPAIIHFHAEQKEDFLRGLDALILCLPQTDANEGFLDQKALDLLAPGAYLVNVGRGALVDEKTLFDALHDKKLGAAALDVWYNYKVEAEDGKRYPYKYPFHKLDNVILSPHRAASPMDDLGRWDELVANLIAVHQGRAPSHEVDLDQAY